MRGAGLEPMLPDFLVGLLSVTVLMGLIYLLRPLCLIASSQLFQQNEKHRGAL